MTALTALIALAAIGVFAAGVIAGIIGLTSVAIRREDRNLTLTSEAADNVTRVGRWLIRAYVRGPRRTAPGPIPATHQRPAPAGS
jgi:hypothetical protein